MNNFETVRTLILSIGWPVLIGGSIYLFVRGKEVYKMVKGSLIGKITKTLILTMMVEMYSLGVITTVYMFDNVKNGVLIGVPIFAIWFVMFALTLKTLISARNEIKMMSQNNK